MEKFQIQTMTTQTFFGFFDISMTVKSLLERMSLKSQRGKELRDQ